MTTNLPLLILAITLLWFPRQWLRYGAIALGKRRRRSNPLIVDPRRERQPDDQSLHFRDEFAKKRNYLDLLRGAAGSWCLMDFCFVRLPAAAGVAPVSALKLLAIQGAILVVAVVIQMVRWEEKISFFGPVFFMIGLAVGACGYEIALFAAALTWVLNIVLPNPATFLFVFAGLLGGFGFVFNRSITEPRVLLAAGLMLFPVVVSVLSGRQLLIMTRKPRLVKPNNLR